MKSINQGEKFMKKKNNYKTGSGFNYSLIEGFMSEIDTSKINKEPTNFSQKSKQVYNDNSYSEQQKNELEELKKQYNYVLDKYTTTKQTSKKEIEDYITRVSSKSDPYLNKNINIEENYGYVSGTGNVEWYPSKEIYEKSFGVNGCPAKDQTVNIDISWNPSYLNPGTLLDTIPRLLTSTNKFSEGQSCGNEGKNVYVNKISNTKDQSEYIGCYGDVSGSRTMKLMSDVPMNYKSCETAAQYNNYGYFGLQNVNEEGLGICYVSNNLDEVQRYGDVSKVYQNTVIWNSDTENKGNNTILSYDGFIEVFDTTNKSIYKSNNQNVKLYVDSGFKGKKSEIGPGEYSSIEKAGIPNDSLGSIIIPTGLSVELFTKGNFGISSKEPSIVLNSGNYSSLSNLPNSKISYNDKVGSLKVISGGNCYLIIKDNGDLIINTGNDPNDSNSRLIWSSNTYNNNTFGENPERKSSLGKYKRNYLQAGENLSKGEWIGSDNGMYYLIMQDNGVLALINSGEPINKCKKQSDSYMYGGDMANAVYKTANLGFPQNLGKVGFIDQNSFLREYPSSMTGSYGYEYTKIENTSISSGTMNTILNTSLDNCKKECDANTSCSGYEFDGRSGVNNCYLKNSNNLKDKTYMTGVDYYVRRPNITNDKTCSKELVNIDSVQWEKYKKSNNPMTPTEKCGIDYTNNFQKNLLKDMEDQLNVLASKIQEKTNELKDKSYTINKQIKTNKQNFDVSAKEYLNIEETKKRTNDNLENMVQDTDILVLYENERYLFWSILSVATIALTINFIK